MRRLHLAILAAIVAGGAAISLLERRERHVRPWPEMGVRGNPDCGKAVVKAFDGDFTDDDLDALIGPRVEEFESVNGPRVRVQGIASHHKPGPCLNPPDHPMYVRVLLDGDWPKDVLGRRVIVEGCLSRTYYSWDASHVSQERLNRMSERQRRNTNLMRALPVGFVYFLHDVKYELHPDQSELPKEPDGNVQ